jgi:hypothetical protein
MSNSNLKAFLNSDIESSEQYFEISQNTIKELIRLQNVQEHQALRCIIEIGQTLSELTHYKKRIKSKSVDTLWSQFVKEPLHNPYF